MIEARELLGVIADAGTPDSAVEQALNEAVLYPEDFAMAAGGEAPTLELAATDARRAALVTVATDEPAVRCRSARRLLYVLVGRVRHTEYADVAAGLAVSDSSIVGVGQVLAFDARVPHRLRAHDGGRTLLLEVLLGADPELETLAVPDEQDGEAAGYYYEYDDCYRTVYAAGAELWEMPEPNEALDAILATMGEELGPRWIDLGCGEGRDSLFLARRGFDVLGVDVSRAALQKARDRARREGLSCTFLERDVTRLRGMPSDGFDVAINMGCLHMLSDPGDRLRHLRRVHDILKPGGCFIVAHCRAQWLKGFYSVPDYEQVGPAITGRVIPRRIRLTGGGETWVELPTTHFVEADEDRLAAELRAAGLVTSWTLSQDGEAFGNTAVVLAHKPSS